MICYKRFTWSKTRIWCFSDLIKWFDEKSFNIYYLSSIQNENIKNESESENENENIFTVNHPASKYSFNTRNINKRSQQILISWFAVKCPLTWHFTANDDIDICWDLLLIFLVLKENLLAGWFAVNIFSFSFPFPFLIFSFWILLRWYILNDFSSNHFIKSKHHIRVSDKVNLL